MQKAVFLFFCLLIPFENTALASIGGVFTAPLGIIMIPLLALQVALSYRSLSETEMKTIRLLFGFFVYSFLLLTFFYSDYSKAFLFDRGLKFLLLVIPPIIVFLVVIRQDEKTIYHGVMITAGMVLFSFFLNLIARDFINTPSFFHQNFALSPHRMRGFTFEASTFGFQFSLAILMVAAIYRINLLIITPFVVASILLITSRGTLICFLFTIFITFVVFSRINAFHKFLLSMILLFSISLFLSAFIGSSFISDIEKYSSLATRGTSIMTAIFSLIYNPIGSGVFGYLPSIYEYGVYALKFVDGLAPGLLNFSEFSSYLVVGETKNVSTKSFFFDWVIYGGVFFIYFYVKYVGRLFLFFVKNRMQHDFAVLLFLVLSSSFFMTIDIRYIAPLALGFVYVRYRVVKKRFSQQKVNESTKVLSYG
ncbi:O-antigen polymerase [Vibrio scophthalmi]|uniref:Putative 49.5 kDa protein in cps region n=1 Tax=Vibrio scophthalmi TaxID=45658 RepID=A0A1C7FFC2_9VIBR|nr:O-antigen polymerase [Vibrio scophthalmi]ANU38621.1 putative 49.5 kDa protein in cps region [Vibrio scophthalmi]